MNFLYILNIICLIALTVAINIKPQIDNICKSYDDLKYKFIASINNTKVRLQKALDDVRSNTDILESFDQNTQQSLQRIIQGKLLYQSLEEIQILDHNCSLILHVHLGLVTTLNCERVIKFLNTPFVISDYEYPKLIYLFNIKSANKDYYIVGVVNLTQEWLRNTLDSYQIIYKEHLYISSKVDKNYEIPVFNFVDNINKTATVFLVSKKKFLSSSYIYAHQDFLKFFINIVIWFLITLLLVLLLVIWWKHGDVVKKYNLERSLFLTWVFQGLKNLNNNLNFKNLYREINFEEAKKIIFDLIRTKEEQNHKLEYKIDELKTELQEKENKIQIIQKQKENIIRCCESFFNIEQKMCIADKLNLNKPSLLQMVLFVQDLIKQEYKDFDTHFFNHYSLENFNLSNTFPTNIFIVSIYFIYKSFILELLKVPSYKTKINTQIKKDNNKNSLIINIFAPNNNQLSIISPNFKYFSCAKDFLTSYDFEVTNLSLPSEVYAIVISWND